MTDAVAAAQRQALAAARDAAVEIAAVDRPDELDVLRSAMRAVWGDEVVPPRNLLRGLALGGAGLLVARRDGAPVGFALGWPGWHDGLHFHSHQVGVVAAIRSSGVGFALKLAQRADCLAHGVSEMRWTFDPLLLANARFNLLRLGAQVVAFHPHCYGDRRDEFNTGDTTDRVEVSWRLDAPVGGSPAAPAGSDRLIAVPADYHALRVSDPSAAAEVRARVGAALAAAFAGGGGVLGLGGPSSDSYVVAAGPSS